MLYSLPPRLTQHSRFFDKRVDDGYADAVQTAGELVVLVREFSARVQPRQDQLNTAELFLRMNVDRHAAAVVRHLQRTVLEQRDVDALGVTGLRFVDRIVDDFVSEVIGSARVRVHAGTPAYGIESAEYFNVGSGIGLGHLEGGIRVAILRTRD